MRTARPGSVSIGLYEGDRAVAGAVYQPVGGELFLAEAGKGTTLNGKRVRVSQGSRLSDALVATGFYYSSKGAQLKRDMAIYARLNDSVLGLRRSVPLLWILPM
ncbi:MAG: inositol monophosphatase family protein [Bdellovibrionota bacterium]